VEVLNTVDVVYSVVVTSMTIGDCEIIAELETIELVTEVVELADGITEAVGEEEAEGDDNDEEEVT
jgi:hypothetical protein